jgi:uridine kinase
VVSPAATRAADVLALAEAAPARLGSGRLLCIDGPAGSGKTTLAAGVHELSGAPVLRMDDLYAGWHGLLDVDAHVLDVLEPLSRHVPGHYRRYDWPAGEFRETHRVAPVPLLVLEGVGAGNRAWSGLVTTLVWVEAPPAVRLARVVARDGEDERAHLVAWMQDEDRLFAEQDTRARADLVIET